MPTRHGTESANPYAFAPASAPVFVPSLADTSKSRWFKRASLACALFQFAQGLIWVSQHQEPTGANQLEGLGSFFAVFETVLVGLLPLVVGSVLGLWAGSAKTNCLGCNFVAWGAAILMTLVLVV